MTTDQTLNALSGRLLAGIDRMIEEEAPDRILVHGDTTTAMITALAAFHRSVPVAHVEAGLRTGNLSLPWPEEMNRRVVDVVADLLFAPTPVARDALWSENLAGRVVVTGNTAVDSLTLALARLDNDAALLSRCRAENFEPPVSGKLVLATCHRRENFGGSLEDICTALKALCERSDTTVVIPVHLNPNVRKPVEATLSANPQIRLVKPQSYLAFVDLLRRADVVLTDSGGVQEEAASLGKPLVVMRDLTERVASGLGGITLVGSDPRRIVTAVNTALDRKRPKRTTAVEFSPYGDGFAARRIVAALAGDPVTEFIPPAFELAALSHQRLG